MLVLLHTCMVMAFCRRGYICFYLLVEGINEFRIKAQKQKRIGFLEEERTSSCGLMCNLAILYNPNS